MGNHIFVRLGPLFTAAAFEFKDGVHGGGEKLNDGKDEAPDGTPMLFTGGFQSRETAHGPAPNDRLAGCARKQGAALLPPRQRRLLTAAFGHEG